MLRFLSLLVLAALCAGVAAGAAGAVIGNTQGDRFRNQGGSDDGTRSWISGSGHPNSTGMIVASVGIQENTTASFPGLFQIGEVKTTSDYTFCNRTGMTAVFAEYRVSGTHTFVCPASATQDITVFGNGHLFAVAVDGSNGWQSYLDSQVFTNPPPLGFASGWSIAKAEAHVDPNSAGPAYTMTWGASTHTAWQYKTASVGYTTIHVSKQLENDDLDNDGNKDWGMGGTPSPFNINWAGW